MGDQCRYKVYPFTNDERYRCQCRVFVIDWDEDLESTPDERADYFNLTQPMIMEGVMSHWTMLEKLKTTGDGGDSTAVHSVDSWSNIPHLKAFEWNDALVSNAEYGVIQWPALEYLSIGFTLFLTQMPMDFGSSPYLKYLSFSGMYLEEIPDAICSLDKLSIIHIEFEEISVIPHCIGTMTQLKAIWIDNCILLKYIPMAIFNLPNLLELSLYRGNISFSSLIEYNVPDDIKNDTQAVNQWFDDNFHFESNHTDYWLFRQPINDMNITELPLSLQTFLTTANYGDGACSDSFVVTQSQCPPRLLGDGRCNHQCTWNRQRDICDYDFGDCHQLCFAPELANCSLENLDNMICDEGCHNIYCGWYDIGSDFDAFGTTLTDVDLYACSWPKSSNDTADESVSFNYSACIESESIYLDPNIPVDYQFPKISSKSDEYPYSQCVETSIGNGWCDDQCRTSACNLDGNDCASSCGEIGSLVYSVWVLEFGEGIYGANHSYVCSELWDGFLTYHPSDDWSLNCSYSLDIVDFNGDKWLNFREFSVLAVAVTTGGFRHYGANFSDCIGMEHYNPYFG